MKNRPMVNFIRGLRAPLLVLAFLLVAGVAVFQFSRSSQASAAPSAPQKNYGELTSIVPNFDPAKAEYVLTAWSRNGMQHVSDTDGAMTLLPPGNVLEAQLIRRGDKPGVVTEGVTITYRLENELDGQYDPAKPLERKPADVTMGRQLLGSGNGLPKPPVEVKGALTLSALDKKTFISAPIPLLPYTEGGSFLPYPLAVVEAKDNYGRVLAYTRAVLPVSTELGCYKCHGGSWSKDGITGISQETALNILNVHDNNHNTRLVEKFEKAKEAREEGKVGVISYGVNCRTCHNDITKARLNVSTSMHSFHATRMGEFKGADACSTCHPSQKVNIVKGQAAGTDPKKDGSTAYLRDVHALKAMDCISCHGPLEDLSLSLLVQSEKEGKDHAADLMKGIKPVMVSSVGDIKPRKAWVNEPDCLSCHNYKVKPSAWNLSVEDKAVQKAAASGQPEVKGRPISAFNKSVQDAPGLYINSHDQTKALRCASCHGSPHALYPASNPYSPDRDNLQPLQYQGVAGPLGMSGNCQVCHIKTPASPPKHHPFAETDELTVSVPEGKELRMLRVNFPHKQHGAIECSTCHHASRTEDKVNEGYRGALKMNAKDMLCTTSGCHDSAHNDAKPYRSYFAAFHGPDRGCLSCHVKLQAEGKVTGPVTCNTCHVERVAAR